MQAFVGHKDRYRTGFLYLAYTIITAVCFYFLRDQFTSNVIFCIIVALEACLTAWTFIQGAKWVFLHAEGITVNSVFRTVTYPWSQIRQYGIDMMPVALGKRTRRSEKAPMITVITKKRKLKIECREDVLQCFAQYGGKPAYDKRQ